LSAEVAAGDYTVAELETDGWELSEISCTDSVDSTNRSTVNLNERSATLRVDEGETVECTFTNLENEVLPKPPVKSPEPEILPKTVKTGVLPFTGSDPYALVGLAGLLIGTGGGLILVRRRKKH
jgi:LPXTG-motif cell wall-anchored protein